MNIGVYEAAKAILQPRPDLTTMLKAIQKERPTLFPGVPRLYIEINENASTRSYDLSSIRACFSGAAPLPMAVAEKFERITGGRIIEGYGLTETSPITHANPIEGKRKEGSIGLPVPDTLAKIVDLDDWTKEVELSHEGELIVSGPQVMAGYYDKPEETEAVIKFDAEGRRWLLTGDIAKMDDEGYFYIVDRKKDLVLVSGFNVVSVRDRTDPLPAPEGAAGLRRRRPRPGDRGGAEGVHRAEGGRDRDGRGDRRPSAVIRSPA